ncbi:MAG: SCO family protein, partial [Burkholderiaceae bacterium]
MKKLIALALVVLLPLLAACMPHKFNSVDITGANYARGFSLADHTGTPRTLADYKGKLVVVFFG